MAGNLCECDSCIVLVRKAAILRIGQCIFTETSARWAIKGEELDQPWVAYTCLTEHLVSILKVAALSLASQWSFCCLQNLSTQVVKATPY